MVKDAYALADVPGAAAAPQKHRRDDFTEADLAAGRSVRYWVKDNSLLGGVVYRLTVRARDAERFVYEVENETAMTFVLVDAVEPGEFRQLHAFERELDGAWRYYALVAGRIKWFRPQSTSFVARADAYFRYASGAPEMPELRSSQ
jgi:hypothetical protein